MSRHWNVLMTWKIFAAASVLLTGSADVYGQTNPATILKTEKIGNWNAVFLSAKEPSIVVALPSDDQKAVFAVQCLTNLRRWSIILTVPGGAFFERGTFEMSIKEPRGTMTHLQLYWQAADTLYAFFDRDENALFQAVRWFDIFEAVEVTVKQQFPDPVLTFQFSTNGAKEATAIPLARCHRSPAQ